MIIGRIRRERVKKKKHNTHARGKISIIWSLMWGDKKKARIMPRFLILVIS